MSKQPTSILSRLEPGNRHPRYLKALFYGAPGTGKTHLIGTAPKTLLLDVDRGSSTVRERENVTVWDVKTWQDITDALYTLMFEKHPFETVAIDTITTLQLIAEQEVDLISYIENPKADTRQAYGRTGAMLRHKLAQFVQLDMNVIFTAHLRFNDTPDSTVDIEWGRYLMVPDVQPAVQRAAFALPDVIGRTFLKDMGDGTVKHAIAFGPDAQALSKERNFDLPREATGLTIPHLIKKVTGTTSKDQENA